MGTILEITLAGRAREVAREDLEPLFAEIARLEAVFTRYEEASDLSRLNAAAGGPPRLVAPELVRILRDCVGFAERTRGSFDVTVGPLVALWREAARSGRLPTPAQRAAARERVGYKKLRLVAGTRVELPEGMAVDLDGVAKGWALDRIAERLRADGVESALLDFGGSSIVALGAPPDAPGWRTLLRDRDTGLTAVLTLRDRALAVSGSFGEWRTIAGRRYGHVIDPRSGEPMTRAYQAVALAPTAAEAEAWSKALLVLGPDEGIALMTARPGVEGLLTDEQGQRFATPGFEAATGFDAQRSS
jgi:thiamine biosynthesis lipoprotein